MIRQALKTLKTKDKINSIISRGDAREKAKMYQRLIVRIGIANTNKVLADVYTDALVHIKDGLNQSLVLDTVIRTLDKRMNVSVDAVSMQITAVLEDVSKDGIKNCGLVQKSYVKKYDMKDYIDVIEKQNIFFIKDHYAGVNDRLKELLKDQFTADKPLGSSEFAQKLSETFSEFKDLDMQYWENFGNHATQRVKNIAIVNQFEQVGVSYAKIMAQIDDRTTPICNQMNGKIIPIKHLVAQKERLLQASSIADVKQAQTFDDVKGFNIFDFDSAELPSNIGIPPYHFGCRTEIVAYFAEDAEDKKVAQYPVQYEASGVEYKTTAIYTVYDAMWGREIIATEWTQTHIEESGRSINAIKEAMRTILLTGQSKQNPKDIIALTKNGYILIFRGNYIHSSFKPDNAKAYFLKETIPLGGITWGNIKRILKSVFMEAFTR